MKWGSRAQVTPALALACRRDVGHPCRTSFDRLHGIVYTYVARGRSAGLRAVTTRMLFPQSTRLTFKLLCGCLRIPLIPVRVQMTVHVSTYRHEQRALEALFVYKILYLVL